MLSHYEALWDAAAMAMDKIEAKGMKTLRLGDSALDLNDLAPDEVNLLINFYKAVGERAERRVNAMRGRQ